MAPRATQFFEFLKAIADGGTGGNVVHLSPSKFQPVAADDVAATLAEIATGQPHHCVVERLVIPPPAWPSLSSRFCRPGSHKRKVVPDHDGKYFGAVLDKDGLAPKGQFIAGTDTLCRLGTRLTPEPLVPRRLTLKKIALLLLAGASLLATKCDSGGNECSALQSDANLFTP